MNIAYIKEHIPYEKSVTVNEHKAPTDASIKLYDEIKEKAYGSILKSISIQDNALNVAAILYDDFYSFEKVLKYRALLNGKEITGEITNLPMGCSRRELIEKIYTEVSRGIAQQIIINMKDTP